MDRRHRRRRPLSSSSREAAIRHARVDLIAMNVNISCASAPIRSHARLHRGQASDFAFSRRLVSGRGGARSGSRSRPVSGAAPDMPGRLPSRSGLISWVRRRDRRPDRMVLGARRGRGLGARFASPGLHLTALAVRRAARSRAECASMRPCGARAALRGQLLEPTRITFRLAWLLRAGTCTARPHHVLTGSRPAPSPSRVISSFRHCPRPPRSSR